MTCRHGFFVTVLTIAVLLIPGAASAEAGALIFAVGKGEIVSSDGSVRQLKSGQKILAGDEIRTDSGRAQIRFSDGATLSLYPESAVQVVEYRFKGISDGEESFVLAFLRGGFRTITGLIGKSKRDAYKVQTTVATIGIRGTEYYALFSKGVLDVAVSEGEVVLASRTGTLYISAGQAGRVEGPGGKPHIIGAMPTLPPAPVLALNEPRREPRIIGVMPTLPPAPSAPSNEPPPPSAPTVPSAPSQPSMGGDGSLLSGTTNLSGVYAISNTLDTTRRLNGLGFDGANVTLASDGRVTDYHWVANPAIESLSRNTASIVDSGSFSDISWGRWTSGSMSGSYWGHDPATLNLNGNQSFHYVFGIPAATLPNTGTASLSLIGATSPTRADGSTAPGSVLGGTLLADFGLGRVGLDMSLSMPGDATYRIQTTGGATSAAASEIGFVGTAFSNHSPVPVTGTGASCSGSCAGTVSGFFTQAQRAGLVYHFGSGGTTGISGVAVFR